MSPGVYYARGSLLSFATSDLQFLLDEATTAPRGRVRLCCHKDPDDTFHEMFIAFRRGVYLPPSHHLKDESFSVLKGTGTCVFFDGEGQVTATVGLGEPGSGRAGYCRLPAGACHSLFVESELFLVHEASTGPFRRSDTVVAGWAPPEGDVAREEELLERMKREVTRSHLK